MIKEALRRLTEHEQLVRHLLAELRDRLTASESGGGPAARPLPRLASARRPSFSLTGILGKLNNRQTGARFRCPGPP
jgi:hypothetical protein